MSAGTDKLYETLGQGCFAWGQHADDHGLTFLLGANRTRRPQHADEPGRDPDREYHQGLPEVMEDEMETTRQLTITLPVDMADALRAKVQSGEYASESEVVREGLWSLLAHDATIEGWLREDVTAAYDALQENPSEAISGAEVRQRLCPNMQKT